MHIYVYKIIFKVFLLLSKCFSSILIIFLASGVRKGRQAIQVNDLQATATWASEFMNTSRIRLGKKNHVIFDCFDTPCRPNTAVVLRVKEPMQFTSGMCWRFRQAQIVWKSLDLPSLNNIYIKHIVDHNYFISKQLPSFPQKSRLQSPDPPCITHLTIDHAPPFQWQRVLQSSPCLRPVIT